MLYPEFDDLLSLKVAKEKWIYSSSKSVRSIASGGYLSSFRGQGIDLEGVREYVAGDDIRSIDWRVTARTGEPHIKIFREERERQVFLCVDLNARMRFGTKNTFKSIQAARIAALLGWSSLATKNRVGAYLFGDVPGGIASFPAKGSVSDFCEVLKALSTPPKDSQEVGFSELFLAISRKVPTGSLVYVVSDFMKIDSSLLLDPAFAWIRQRCNVVFIQVTDPADFSLSPVGSLAVKTGQESFFYLDTQSSLTRERYSDLAAQRQQRLLDISARSQIPCFSLSTKVDIRQELMLQMKKIGRKKT